MRSHLPRVIGHGRAALDSSGASIARKYPSSGVLASTTIVLPAGKPHQQIRPDARVFCGCGGLRGEVAVFEHARHLHHPPQLDLAPVAAHVRRAQRGYQAAGLRAKLRLRFEQRCAPVRAARHMPRRATFPALGFWRQLFPAMPAPALRRQREPGCSWLWPRRRDPAAPCSCRCEPSPTPEFSHPPFRAMPVPGATTLARACVFFAAASAESSRSAASASRVAAQHKPSQREPGDEAKYWKNTFHLQQHGVDAGAFFARPRPLRWPAFRAARETPSIRCSDPLKSVSTSSRMAARRISLARGFGAIDKRPARFTARKLSFANQTVEHRHDRGVRQRPCTHHNFLYIANVSFPSVHRALRHNNSSGGGTSRAVLGINFPVRQFPLWPAPQQAVTPV